MKYLDIRYYAYGLANYVYKIKNANAIPFSHNDRYILFYSWRIHITNIFQSIVLFSIAFALGIPKEIILAISAFVSLRFYAGGAHTNALWQCTTTSIVIMLTSVYIGRLIDLSIGIPLLMIALGLLLIYSPSDHKNRPIHNNKTRTLYKRLSILVFLFWTIISILYPTLSGIIVTSILIECLTLIKKKAVTTA